MKNSIKRVAILSVAALVAVSAAGCADGAATKPAPGASAQATKPAPKISAPEPIFKFGKIKQGKEVEHVFKIRNTGNAPLKIEKAKGS